MFAFVLQPTLLKLEESYMPNLIMKNQVTKGKSNSVPRVAKLCTNTSKGKEIFIFTAWEK